MCGNASLAIITLRKAKALWICLVLWTLLSHLSAWVEVMVILQWGSLLYVLKYFAPLLYCSNTAQASSYIVTGCSHYAQATKGLIWWTCSVQRLLLPDALLCLVESVSSAGSRILHLCTGIWHPTSHHSCFFSFSSILHSSIPHHIRILCLHAQCCWAKQVINYNRMESAAWRCTLFWSLVHRLSHH